MTEIIDRDRYTEACETLENAALFVVFVALITLVICLIGLAIYKLVKKKKIYLIKIKFIFFFLSTTTKGQFIKFLYKENLTWEKRSLKILTITARSLTMS